MSKWMNVVLRQQCPQTVSTFSLTSFPWFSFCASQKQNPWGGSMSEKIYFQEVSLESCNYINWFHKANANYLVKTFVTLCEAHSWFLWFSMSYFFLMNDTFYWAHQSLFYPKTLLIWCGCWWNHQPSTPWADDLSTLPWRQSVLEETTQASLLKSPVLVHIKIRCFILIQYLTL